MYKIYALWSHPDDVDGFEEAYLGTHAPLAAKLPGLRSFVTLRGEDLEGDPLHAPHFRIAELEWDSKHELEKCQRSPEWEALITNGGQMRERFAVTVHNVAGEPDAGLL